MSGAFHKLCGVTEPPNVRTTVHDEGHQVEPRKRRKKMLLRTVCLFLVLVLVLQADHKVRRIEEAGRLLEQVMQASDRGIPHDLLAKAHCVALIPGAKRGAFIVGAQYGVGVALCRHPRGWGWTGPSTVRIEGGSFGLQLGGGELDVVLLVMNNEGARKLMRSEFTLGGDAGAMAGPIGRTVTAETDVYMHAKILSYSRSRGVFAGVALKGSTFRSDDDANRVIYGAAVSHESILSGKVRPPAAAKKLVALLNRYSDRELSFAAPFATGKKRSTAIRRMHSEFSRASSSPKTPC
jgi:lipid-binding SYLF domain-containing protein